MAAGDIKWFAQALEDIGNKIHNIGSDTLKVGLITSATTPAIGTAAPHWNGTGTTDMSANKVSEGGTTWTGPKTLASKTWSLNATTVPTLRAAIISLAQDASGFTNARWGILYNDTDANKRCLAYVDLGVDRSIVTGSLDLDWYGANNEILSLTQS
jgi:hypothetical protein